jgi:pilus assembly protein Flp/PilA
MKMIQNISNKLKNQKGQGMVEYALIVALIAIVAIAALTPLGNAIRSAFNGIQTSFDGAASNSADSGA